MEPVRNGNLSLEETVYSSEDRNFKYLYEREPVRKGRY